MNQRQQALLQNITWQYIKTASPVSSKLITEDGGFGLSSATIRNEMAELEDAGYICHPHTSAGRVPTEKGYQFYVENFLKPSLPTKKQQDNLEKSLEAKKFETQSVKSLAKNVEEFSDGAVFVAFAKNDFYYTGLSNLFGQPEFAQHQLIYNLSQVIDHLDQVITKIFSTLNAEVNVAVGSKNQFARDCSAVIAKYQNQKQTGLIGILGPMRMDYQNNFNLIKYSQELINSLK